LPTPTVSDNRGASREEVRKLNPKKRLKVEVELLPTTRVSMANGPTKKEIEQENPKSRIEVEVVLSKTNWKRYKKAIAHWEEIIKRKAPEPTKPDGREGREQINPEFTEFMMGLPSGWITDVGLTRNEALKACGNGVVPQQAELALRILVESMEQERKDNEL
jgi:DNA (cytosine-5)-methyltransferase 1